LEGGRYKAALFDEFPFWPGQEFGLCVNKVGTSYGKNNRSLNCASVVSLKP
jgi:hypothetical protein